MAQIGRCDRCKAIVNNPLEHMSKVFVADLNERSSHEAFKDGIELCVTCTAALVQWLKEAPPQAAPKVRYTPEQDSR